MSGVLVDYAEKLWARTSAEYRAVVVAFIFAPAAALCLIWLAGPAPSTRAAVAPPVSIIPLRSRLDAQSTPSTTVVIVQPTEATFSLPVTEPLASLPTSLLDEEWRANTTKISAENQTLSITAPLYGIHEPFVFVTQAAPPDALDVSGRRYALADMRLPSQQATDILLGVLISAAFALGLGVSTAAVPVRPQEDGSG